MRLDPERNRLEGWTTIHYRSGADSALTAIHLHTYPNAFAHPNTIYAREAARVGENHDLRFAKPEARGWITLDSATANAARAEVVVNETLARVELPQPLQPGDSVAVRLRFRVQIPEQFDRFGRTGSSYSIAQWYPKVVVYDELGWHLDPFHYVSEFFGEFATYDVAITLPDRFWVGATGVLGDVRGGDNEVPLFPRETPRDSVEVALTVTLADSLEGRWPAGGLRVESDLRGPKAAAPHRWGVPRDGTVTLRVPRGAPVHYTYAWEDSLGGTRDEADTEGGAAPVRLLLATENVAARDTIRALAAVPAPQDTLLPSMKTLRYRAERVHDFAWVASPEYVRSDTTWSGIQIRTLVYRADEEKWKDVPRQLVEAFETFTRMAGPYPWPQFTLSEAWCGGGAMEYPMLVMTEPTMRHDYLHVLEDTNTHELAHQWFYGFVASDERAHPWLDEGFSQFLEQEHMQRKRPEGLFRLTGKYPWLRGYTPRVSDELAYLERAWARDEAPIATPADKHLGYRTYGVAAYSKPSMMLHTLRGVMGDSAYAGFLREYVRRQSFRHPTPEDMVAVAIEYSEQDLGEFFRSWVETVDRPSFALGKVRREREGDRHRTSVTVRRLEAMSFPVPVEARFKDGTAQTLLVPTSDRENVAVFESDAPLEGVRLDPRHEIIEMNRLDNGTGLLPPMHVRPIYGFPSADAIGIDAGPTVWYGEEEGARLGAWLDGRYLPSVDFPYGILGFEAGVSYGTRNESVAYRAGAWKRWGLLGARSRVRGLVARDAGLFRAGLSASNTIMEPSQRHPYRRWSASLEYRDRDELAPVDARYWSLGRTLEGTVTIGIETIGPRRSGVVSLALRKGTEAFRDEDDPSPAVDYEWLKLTLAESRQVPPLNLSLRLAAGTAYRDVPLERQFDIAEESRVEALSYFFANDRGPLRETDHFLVPGGGGLRAYAGQAILGQKLLAGTLEIAHEAYPLFAFADVGRVEASGLGEEGRRELTPMENESLADAGIGFRYGPLEVAFPFWKSHPAEDESPWRFRWTFSIGPVTVPSP
ncbi:MAG TPA: M1 family aminopeptidase [Candidatus Eisenbacteria bacterium]|nr:M1 family aminopeptidase [Candidatus Eisenbacteria bacterium]